MLMLCLFLRKSGFSFGIRCQVNFLHCWLSTKITLCITDLAINPFTGNPGQLVDVHSILPQLRLTVGRQKPPRVNPQLPVKGLTEFYLKNV